MEYLQYPWLRSSSAIHGQVQTDNAESYEDFKGHFSSKWLYIGRIVS